MNKIDVSKCWTTTAYSRAHNIPVRTVQDWCEKGKLKAVKVGGHEVARDIWLIIKEGEK